MCTYWTLYTFIFIRRYIQLCEKATILFFFIVKNNQERMCRINIMEIINFHTATECMRVAIENFTSRHRAFSRHKKKEKAVRIATITRWLPDFHVPKKNPSTRSSGKKKTFSGFIIWCYGKAHNVTMSCRQLWPTNFFPWKKNKKVLQVWLHLFIYQAIYFIFKENKF